MHTWFLPYTISVLSSICHCLWQSFYYRTIHNPLYFHYIVPRFSNFFCSCWHVLHSLWSVQHTQSFLSSFLHGYAAFSDFMLLVGQQKSSWLEKICDEVLVWLSVEWTLLMVIIWFYYSFDFTILICLYAVKKLLTDLCCTCSMCDLSLVLQVSFHLQNVLSAVKLVICRAVVLTTQKASTQMVLHTCDLQVVCLLTCICFTI